MLREGGNRARPRRPRRRRAGRPVPPRATPAQRGFPLTRRAKQSADLFRRQRRGARPLIHRKNFKSREEAIAGKATQELNTLQADASLLSATTFLLEKQLHKADHFNPAHGEAPPAFRLPRFCPDQLSRTANEALSTYAVKECIAAYGAAKTDEFE